MITIVLANNKGGVGKTTSALNIADALVARDATVLLIDGDQQGNLTQSFSYNPPISRTLAAVLLGRTTLADAVQEMRPGLYLLPAGTDLNDAVTKRAQQPGAELVLRKLLREVKIDYCVIDTPGSMGTLTDAALTAADAVFIPAHPVIYGVKGLVDLITRCHAIQDGLNPRLLVGGIFFTQYNRADRRIVLRNTVSVLEGHGILGPLIMRNTVRDNVAVKEAQDQKMSLLAYAPDCHAASDYVILTAEMLLRLHHE